jgi:TetR/AcrR family transcriptional regulator
LATTKRTRIQTKNRAIIERAALEIFSRDGFRGATVDAIADAAGMSKPNLLYYFPTKDDIYRSLLEGLLEDWLAPLVALDPSGEPVEQIAAYIDRKVELARDFPMESRLFAGEMLRGAPILSDELAGNLKAMVDDKAAVIRAWMDEGRLKPVDPHHLIFAIWATTQHYADFDVQVRTLLNDNGDQRFDSAAAALKTIFLDGLRPR